MRLRAGAICTALLAVVVAAPRAAAQESTPSAPSVIAEIHFTGSHYSDPLLARTSGLKPGNPVTPEQLQAVADHLARLGVFARVNYRYTSNRDGIALQFDLEDAPTVPVSFDNFPWFTDQEFISAIRNAVPLFDGRAPTAGTLLDEMTSAVAGLLPTRGITGTIERNLMVLPSGEGMMMQLRLVGPELIVGSLEYGDALAETSEKLRDRNSDLIGKPFSRFAIELFLAEQVRPLYLAAGHLRIHFAVPKARFVGDPTQSLPSKVLVLLPIDPGPVFHFSGVSWNGNGAIDAETLTRLFLFEPGQLAGGIQLMDRWQRVEQEFRHRGYLDVKIDPQAQFNDAAATVSYRVAITQGPQYRMRNLILTGLSPEAADAVRLRWELRSGQIADGVYIDEMLAKLEQPSREIFGNRPVHYAELGSWLRTDPESQTIDVLLDFQ